jgi:uncharacterized protein
MSGGTGAGRATSVDIRGELPPGFPQPIVTSLTRPFWDATLEGRLVVQECADCDHRWWTPQIACTRCLGENWAWRECSGLGSLYSFTVVHRSPDPSMWPAPFVVAIVELEEGPHLLTNIVTEDFESLLVGMPVRVMFHQASDEIAHYVFRPI